MKYAINVILDGISIFVLVILFVANNLRKSRNYRSSKLNMIMICLVSVIIFDISAWMISGTVFRGATVISLILDTLYYIAQIVYCRVWVYFVTQWIKGPKKNSLLKEVLYSIPMIIEIVLILVNMRTGWMFSINSNNMYTRGKLFEINLVPFYIYIIYSVVFAMYYALRYRGTDTGRNSLTILTYMFLPICSAIAEYVSYGISWIWPFMTISLLAAYMNIQSQIMLEERLSSAEESTRYTQLKNELTNCRVRIMLSQIQPHFMFNSLSVIQALCDTDPDVAAKAIEDFSIYLRCNIDSLNSDKLIPFSKELQHTKKYLALEKLRFEDKLSIAYDIQTESFSLPALTMQSVAENAVRYGISKKEDNGDLLIKTCENDMEYTVIIEDSGVGFDINDMPVDGKLHVGIQDVRKRLEMMCGGSLTINSIPGRGTTVVISIPKKENSNGYIRS